MDRLGYKRYVAQGGDSPEEIYTATRSWTEKAFLKLIFYKRHAKGGHFAAWEQPLALTEDIREGFRSLRWVQCYGRRAALEK